MELKITWARVVRIWWALLWRHLVVMLGAMVCGGIVGMVFGVIGVLLGFPKEAIIWPARILGGLIGLAASTIPVRWILGSTFGEFRIVLLSTIPPTPAGLNQSSEQTAMSVTSAASQEPPIPNQPLPHPAPADGADNNKDFRLRNGG